MPGQKVCRCEPESGHSGPVFSIRRLDFPSLGKKVIDQFQTSNDKDIYLPSQEVLRKGWKNSIWQGK